MFDLFRTKRVRLTRTERRAFERLRELDYRETVTGGKKSEYNISRDNRGHAIASNGMSMDYDLTADENVATS